MFWGLFVSFFGCTQWAQGTIWDIRDKAWINCVKGKHSTFYASTPTPVMHFFPRKYLGISYNMHDPAKGRGREQVLLGSLSQIPENSLRRGYVWLREVHRETSTNIVCMWHLLKNHMSRVLKADGSRCREQERKCVWKQALWRWSS